MVKRYKLSGRHPPPHAAPPAALAPRSPPFHFRVCVGVRPGGRAGRRGGARRSASGGGGGPALGPFLRSLRRAPAVGVGVAVRQGTGRGRRSSPHAPALAHPALPGCPPHGGGGAEAPRARERGERSHLPGWQRRSTERNFSLQPPARGPQPALPPRGGAAPEAGARGQGRPLGDDGEGGSPCIGVPFPRPPCASSQGWGLRAKETLIYDTNL